MPSDGNSGKIPGASLLQGSQAASSINPQQGGKHLPPGGKSAAVAAVGATESAAVPSTAAASKAPTADQAQPVQPKATDPQSLVSLLNSHLNDSGRPDQYRIDPSGGRFIQQINPSNGEVVGEFSVDEFPALARSIGVSSLFVDSLA